MPTWSFHRLNNLFNPFLTVLDVKAYTEQLFASQVDFDVMCEALWKFQLKHNTVLGEFCSYLDTQSLTYLPIEFFKEFEITTLPPWEAAHVFESSGTTGQIPSRHYIRDLAIYKRSLTESFFHFFPNQQYVILSLTPTPQERPQSSLVYMVDTWIKKFGLAGSGFFLNDLPAWQQAIEKAGSEGKPMLIIGLAYALLDFAEISPLALPQNTIVLETGGMKGRRKEMLRTQLHNTLREAWQIPIIYSEYSMTELMSQAYSDASGRFRTPPWMKVIISDIHLPELPANMGESGRINFIDLANIHSCAFISSSDLGRMYADGSFEVLGRLDQAELRGCSLMYE